MLISSFLRYAGKISMSRMTAAICTRMYVLYIYMCACVCVCVVQTCRWNTNYVRDLNRFFIYLARPSFWMRWKWEANVLCCAIDAGFPLSKHTHTYALHPLLPHRACSMRIISRERRRAVWMMGVFCILTGPHHFQLFACFELFT